MVFAPMSRSAEHAKNALGAHHDPFAITSWNLDDMGVPRHVVCSSLTCLHSIRVSLVRNNQKVCFIEPKSHLRVSLLLASFDTWSLGR
jgi:hypothetical protein